MDPSAASLLSALADMVVPVIGILSAPLILWVILKSKNKRREDVQLTLRQMIKSDQILSPELIDSIQGETTDRTEKDLRWGVILIAFSIGFSIFSLLIFKADGGKHLAAALTVLLIGIAYLFLWKYGKNKEQAIDKAKTKGE